MIIVVSDNNLENFEEKLVETNQKYDVESVEVDNEYGIYIARFTVNQWEKGCIKIKNSYVCKKCKMFIAEKKDDGYIHYNSKCKFASNGREIKITCKCGEIHLIKI